MRTVDTRTALTSMSDRSDPVVRRILGLDGWEGHMTSAAAWAAYEADPRRFDFVLLGYLPNADRPPMLSCLRRHIAIVGAMCRSAANLGDLESVGRYKADLRHAAQALLAEWAIKLEVEGWDTWRSMDQYLAAGRYLPFAAHAVGDVDLRGLITPADWHTVWDVTQGGIADYVACAHRGQGRAYFMPPGSAPETMGRVLPYTLREWLAVRGVDVGTIGTETRLERA